MDAGHVFMAYMDTWKFAHEYCGKLWWKIGWFTIIPSALIYIPLYHSDENTIGIAGVILVTIQCICEENKIEKSYKID